MLFLFFIALVFALEDNEFVITKDVIQTVNTDASSTWKAGVNAVFAGKTWGEIKSMVSWMGERNVDSFATPDATGMKVPDAWDTYTQWPDCKHPIRNQGQCGSCWAFSAAEVMTDRFCIAHSKNVILSPQDLISCDQGEMACQGGYLSTEWDYIDETGIVTDACFPYDSAEGDVPSCPNSCVDGSDWNSVKHKGTNKQHFTTCEAAQENMVQYGSIQGGFTVYQDFFSYTGGVYTHKTGGVAGGHAIKIQGWGVDSDSGLDYWNVANSWGPDWGLEGYFWIKRGTDECGIEDQMYAAEPVTA